MLEVPVVKIRAKAPYLEELVDWLMGIDLIQIEQNEIELSPSFLLFFSFRFLPEFYLQGQSKEDPDPLRFEESFQKFSSEDRGIQSFGNDLTLFTGSSSIRKWTTLSTDFPEIQLLNRGFGGAHISDLIHYYPKLFPHYKPKRIILYCGENDLWSGKSYPQVLEDFQILWQRIRSDLPNVT